MPASGFRRLGQLQGATPTSPEDEDDEGAGASGAGAEDGGHFGAVYLASMSGGVPVCLKEVKVYVCVCVCVCVCVLNFLHPFRTFLLRTVIVLSFSHHSSYVPRSFLSPV